MQFLGWLAGWPSGRPTDGPAAGGSVNGSARMATCRGACLHPCLPACLLACKTARSATCLLSCHFGCTYALLPAKFPLARFAQPTCRLISFACPPSGSRLASFLVARPLQVASATLLARFAGVPAGCLQFPYLPACRSPNRLACWRAGLLVFALDCLLAALFIWLCVACLLASSFEELLRQVVIPSRRGSWCDCLPVQLATGPSGGDLPCRIKLTSKLFLCGSQTRSGQPACERIRTQSCHDGNTQNIEPTKLNNNTTQQQLDRAA
jgi:hypothetical protein